MATEGVIERLNARGEQADYYDDPINAGFTTCAYGASQRLVPNDKLVFVRGDNTREAVAANVLAAVLRHLKETRR
jgi:hypothetical protein